jgi:hypothetical protein
LLLAVLLAMLISRHPLQSSLSWLVALILVKAYRLIT